MVNGNKDEDGMFSVLDVMAGYAFIIIIHLQSAELKHTYSLERFSK